MIKVADARVGTCIMHRGEPAKVTAKERVTVGTHMHSKTRLVVQGVFSGRSEVLTLGHHENLEDLEIINKKGQVIAKIPGQNQLQIMDMVSYETVTATVDEKMFSQIGEGYIVTFIELLGKIVVIEFREAKE
jgi:translation elongation factor P/translation initiation factor 5A